MTRRKIVFLKWTLVLLVVIFCPSVCPRPQDSSPSLVISSSTSNIDKDKPTENPIRYMYSHISVDLSPHKLPVVYSHVNKNNNSRNDPSGIINANIKLDKKPISNEIEKSIRISTVNISKSHRKNRLITAIYSNDPNISEHLENLPYNINIPKNINTTLNVTNDKRKPAIKKIITKWTDSTKDEEFHFTHEASTSNENHDLIALKSIKFGPLSKENVEVSDAAEKVFNPQDIKKIYNLFRKKQKHKPHHSDTMQVYSDNIHVTDDYSYHNPRPTYIFTTPTPTPIITNVGEPKPWSRPSYSQTNYRPTTKKPIKLSKPLQNQYHNSVHNNYPHYPDTDFGVTTFPPSTTYTDRIVIRPEEYSGSPDECPTIFLTLNNTFEGQAKEACPDLNIAVNTNVINKNVVIESEEEETEGIFPDSFNVPYEDDSGDEDGYSNLDSDENQEQTESDSIEALDLTNYNANAIQSESSEPATAASNPLSALQKPGRPVKDDDDIFSLSPILSFFKPAISAMSSLVSLSPLTFGLFSLLLSPLMFIVAGTSGVATLLAPFTFSAREAPKLVHVYRPHWHWDNQLKTWQLHTFDNFNDRTWNPIQGSWGSRSSKETNEDNTTKETFFLKLKDWMKTFTKILRERQNNKNQPQNLNIHRKNKRKKRETWTKRIK